MRGFFYWRPQISVDSYDPVTGRPIFNDNGAPDIAVDDTEVGKYAAEVGNTISGTTAYRNAYPYARKGLLCSNTTTGSIDIHNGTGWVERVSDTGWVNLALTSGSTTSGGLTPQIRKINGIVFVQGRVTQPSAQIADIPAGFRPAQDMRFSAQTGSTGSAVTVVGVSSAGVLFTSAGATVNLGFSWVAA